MGVGGCWKLRESEGGTMSCGHDSFLFFVFVLTYLLQNPVQQDTQIAMKLIQVCTQKMKH